MNATTLKDQFLELWQNYIDKLFHISQDFLLTGIQHNHNLWRYTAARSHSS
ncbi:MAG: hypothetical protein V7K57_04560 [Nostoc sp.]|uniref:hypothetical protein n=1 Tax=Nostoc sp. TaxID=1180 RepID=UPI002FFAE3BF